MNNYFYYASVEHEAWNWFQYAGIAILIQSVLESLPFEYHHFIFIHFCCICCLLVCALLADLEFYPEPLNLDVQLVRFLTNLIIMSLVGFATLALVSWLDMPYFDDKNSPGENTDRILKKFGSFAGRSLLVGGSLAYTMTQFAVIRTVIDGVHLVLMLIQLLLAKTKQDY